MASKTSSKSEVYQAPVVTASRPQPIAVSEDKTPPPDLMDDMAGLGDDFGDFEDFGIKEKQSTDSKDDASHADEGTEDADFDDALGLEGEEVQDDKPPVDAKKKSDDKIPDLPDDLVEEAEAYGLDPEDFKTPEALERTIAQLEFRSGSTAEPGQTVPQETSKKTNQEAIPDVSDFKPYELNIDPDNMDPETVAQTLGEMNDHYAKQSQSLQSRLDKIERTATERERAVAIQEYETSIGELGEEYESILGKGPVTGKDITNGMIDNRGRHINAMNQIRAGRAKNGLPPLSQSSLVKRAALQLFKGKPTVSKTNEKQRKPKGQFTQPPKTRKNTGTVTTGDAKAIEAVSALMKEHDM